jgi:hypothetical protein
MKPPFSCQGNHATGRLAGAGARSVFFADWHPVSQFPSLPTMPARSGCRRLCAAGLQVARRGNRLNSRGAVLSPLRRWLALPTLGQSASHRMPGHEPSRDTLCAGCLRDARSTWGQGASDRNGSHPGLVHSLMEPTGLLGCRKTWAMASPLFHQAILLAMQ